MSLPELLLILAAVLLLLGVAHLPRLGRYLERARTRRTLKNGISVTSNKPVTAGSRLKSNRRPTSGRAARRRSR